MIMFWEGIVIAFVGFCVAFTVYTAMKSLNEFYSRWRSGEK
jgi:hypothetical protein